MTWWHWLLIILGILVAVGIAGAYLFIKLFVRVQ